MAGNDETVKLVLDVDATGVKKAQVDTYKFAQTIQHASGETYEFADDAKFLSTVLGQEAVAADGATTSITKLSAAKKAAAAASKEMARGNVDVGRAALEASRGLEDLQYGLGGVINNIPSLVMAFGGGAGLTAAIALTSIAINQLVKHWGDFAALWEERNPIPHVTDTIDGMEDAIKKNNKELDKMKEATSLNNTELKHFNELSAETIELEKKKAEAKAKQRELDQVMNAKSEKQSNAAKDFKEALDGKGAETLAGIEAALKEEDESKLALAKKESTERLQAGIRRRDTIDQQVAAAEAEKNYVANAERFVKDDARRKKAAEDLLLQANEGDEGAQDHILRLAGHNYKAGGKEFKAVGSRLRQRRDDRTQKADDQKDKALTDELNKQGEQGTKEAMEMLANQYGLSRVPSNPEEFNRTLEAKKHKDDAAKKKVDDSAKKNAEKQKKEALEQTHDQTKRQIKAENMQIANSGLVNNAALALAQVKAQGARRSTAGSTRWTKASNTSSSGGWSSPR